MKEITTLRIAGIIRESIVDGPGIRFAVFGQGCPHNCADCHNPDSHDFEGGYDCAIDKILEEIDKNMPDLTEEEKKEVEIQTA